MKKLLIFVSIIIFFIVSCSNVNNQKYNQPKIDLTTLLGQTIESTDFVSFITEYKGPYTIDRETQPGVIFYYSINDGIEFRLVNENITTIFIYNENIQGYKKYIGPPLNGISIDLTRKEVNAKLGEPTEKGGGVQNEYIGYISEWDKYDFLKYYLHFSYDSVGKIETITINQKTDIQLTTDFLYLNDKELNEISPGFMETEIIMTKSDMPRKNWFNEKTGEYLIISIINWFDKNKASSYFYHNNEIFLNANYKTADFSNVINSIEKQVFFTYESFQKHVNNDNDIILIFNSYYKEISIDIIYQAPYKTIFEKNSFLFNEIKFGKIATAQWDKLKTWIY